MRKTNLLSTALIVVITIIIMGGGSMYYWQTRSSTEAADQVPYNGAIEPSDPVSEDPTAPLSYSINGVSASISVATVPFDYTAERLKNMAEECGTQHDEGYFDQLVTKFGGTTKTIYNFKYTGASQAADTFVVTLLPNKAGYSSLDEFRKDFDQCYAGGDAYPAKLNSNWLLFQNSCGSGFDDGSGNPIGCQEVKDVVSPTLELHDVAALQNATTKDANEIAGPTVDQYYIAEKSGTTTTVYRDTYNSRAREEVLSFEEASTYEPSSGNTYRDMRPSVTYDRNSDTFAYTSTEGLFLYNNLTDKTTTLVSNLGSSGSEIDGIDIPIWSAEELADVLSLIYPQFSADGKYLSFSGTFYEGMSTYIINLKNQDIVELAGSEDRAISGYSISWSSSGHNLALGRGMGYGSAGLFSVTNEDFGNAEELLSAAGIEFFDMHGAFYVDKDTIVYTWTPNANDSKRTDIINTDGSEQRVLIENSLNDNYAVGAYGEQVVYQKTDINNPALDGLYIFNIADGSNRQAVAEKAGQDLILQHMNGDTLVYITANTTTQSSTLNFVNPDTLEKRTSIILDGKNTAFYFLGNEYMLF